MSKNHPTHTRMQKQLFEIKRLVAASLLLAGLTASSHAQSTWNGSTSTDWNTAANWTAGVPSGGNAIITSNSPNIATITATISAIPTDILVGTGLGTTGQVNHLAGDASTGEGNWMFLGWQGGNATYNLANTTTTGGAFTGFGQGSGNLNVGGSLQNGNLFVGLDGGTVSKLNINSSGTLAAGGLMVGANGGSTGTVNMDNGTVNLSGDAQIGSSFFGNGFSGRLNQSGGSFTANIVSFSRGSSAAAVITGVGNLTGGTLNSRQWFTLGFAGSASSLAAVTNNGGTINVNTSGGGNLELCVFDPISSRLVLNSGAVTLQNNGSIQFGVLGHSGTSTLDHNGGTVTFYSDAGTTVGGTGGIVLGNQGGVNPWEISSGTYAYNLNGGTLTVPQISKTSPNGSGAFNFNGGTIKPTGTTATFMQGLTAANLQAGGAIIDTAGFDITIGQALLGSGTLAKNGAGILTLSGTSTYTGNTVINNGTLALSGSGSLASQVIIPTGRTFDVSGVTGGNVQNPMSGVGTVNGSVVATATVAIYPATDGTVGSLTFNNNLDLSGGGSLRFDVSTSHLSGNDQVVVTGNLSVSSATSVRVKALSGAANLSTAADYVLCAVSGTTTLASSPSLAWDGTPPANYLSFSVQQVGNNLVLHFTPATAPTVTATSTPATVVRNQRVTVTATVTPGSGSVTNVQVDASPIGSSATAALVLSSTANVYTNTFPIPASLAPGVKVMTVVAKANTGLNSPGFSVTNTVVATNEVWIGAGLNDNWSTSPNWNVAAPGLSADAVTFAGTTRLTPNLDANYSVTGVTFDGTAGSFTLGTANSSTLTLAANGVVNNSANPQTLNIPVTMSGAQTFNAAAGNLILSQALTKGGSLVTVTGAAQTVFSSPITDSGSLFKRGSGTLTIANNSAWDLAQAASGGFGGPLMVQAGTLKLNNASTHAVTGELVIGGVVANGGVGNNAAIVVDNATLNVSSWLSVGRGNGTGTVSSDLILTNGAIVTAANASAGYNAGNGANKPKGSITLHDTSSLTIGGDFHVAEAAGANFNVTLNGSSTLTYGNFMDLAIGFGGTVANMTLNGGTVNCGGDSFIGHWGDGTATLAINSGAYNVGTGGERWMFMGYWDRVNGVINVSGGAFNLMNNSKLKMARNVNHGGNAFAHVINQSGGQVTFYSDAGTTPGGSGFLDLQDTGAALGSSTYNLNGGTLTIPAIISTGSSGTRVFNFNGGTLKAATDSVTLLDLGAGNAHAYARSGGAIIDTDGKNVLVNSALEHFSGDSGDGGLNKKGLGTLTLNGANSYLGNTVVGAGTLALAQATLVASSSVSISNAAVLELSFATTNRVKALLLNGVSQVAGVYNNTTTPTYITGIGSLLVQPVATNPTNITAVVSGNILSLSWPNTHLGWTLQTNSVSLVSSGSWYPLAGSAFVTGVNLMINPSQTNVFFRLVSP